MLPPPVQVTQHPACVLRITILKPQDTSSASTAGCGPGGSNSNGTATGGNATSSTHTAVCAAKFQVSALVVAHAPIELGSAAGQTALVEQVGR
jgi:hypothetical protein